MPNVQFNYKGDLARPLRPGESAESKLSLLMTNLAAANYRDAVCAMLRRHVIGKKKTKKTKWDYPLEVRGEAKKRPDTASRLPALYKHLAVCDDKSALLALAIRHCRGFQPAREGKSIGGRPHTFSDRVIPTDGVSGGVADPLDISCHLVDMIDNLMEDATRLGKRRTVMQCAKLLVQHQATMQPTHPFYEVSARAVAQAYHQRKRIERSIDRKHNEALIKFRKSIGLPV